MTNPETVEPHPSRQIGQEARALMRGAVSAGLATALPHEGAPWPYASLVLSCHDHAARPLLLISDLAAHSENLKQDPRLALLYDATAGLADPLTGARVTLLGRVERYDDEALLDRFVARHPGAAIYRGFADFALYRVEPERAHLVAGFGKIHWIEAADIVLNEEPGGDLLAREADIVSHMNNDHADAVAAMAQHLSGLPGAEAALVGVDPEGADIRQGALLRRIAFKKIVHDAEACRVELVRLTKQARAAAAG